MTNDNLNLPGRLARYFIESKLTILMIAALLILGSVALIFTPREENPQIVVPAAEVIVMMPGATPLEVENLLLSPLESDLSSIDGVKHVYGTALSGMARVTLEFEVGENKDDAIVRVYDHVLRNRAQLPPGATEPVIKSIDIDNVPVFTVTLSSMVYDDHELRRVAERMLEKLRSVKGTGIGYVTGGLPREVRIEVQPEKLQSYGVTVKQLASAIQNSDNDLSLGSRVYNNENISMRVDGRLENVQELKNIIVYRQGNRIIRISDLANVIDGPPTE